MAVKKEKRPPWTALALKVVATADAPGASVAAGPTIQQAAPSCVTLTWWWPPLETEGAEGLGRGVGGPHEPRHPGQVGVRLFSLI